MSTITFCIRFTRAYSKGDAKGLHWEFVWKAKAFPPRKEVIVRVYMNDGSTIAEREQVAEQGLVDV